jgi:hypothetical protein
VFKKKLALSIGIILVVGIAAVIGYEVLLPRVIARSITGNPSPLMPDRLRDKIQHIRKPVNDGAEVVVETVKDSDVSMSDIYRAIDEAREEQALAMLDELNDTHIKSTNQVFDIAKKHFPVRFDVEIFRKPFNDNASLPALRKGLRYANLYKDRNELDAETAKTILKNILSQKEEELLAEVNGE